MKSNRLSISTTNSAPPLIIQRPEEPIEIQETSIKKINSQTNLNKRKIQELFIAQIYSFSAIKEVSFLNILFNLLSQIFTQFMNFLVKIVFTHFLGNTKDITLLTGVNFGITYNNMFLSYICLGIINGMSMFCPKSFAQKRYKLIGVQTNQVRLMVLIVFILYIIISLNFGKQILCLLSGTEGNFIIVAYKYVIYSSIGNFFELFFLIHSKYCESHMFYKPILQGLVISVLVNFIFCYLFIHYYKLGEIGAALTYNLTNVIKFLHIFLSVECVNPFPKSNFWFNKENFNTMIFKKVFKICSYSMFIGYSDTLGYCLANIFSIRLSELSYAKYIVLENVDLLISPISIGANNTVTTLTSYFYGLKQKNNIRKGLYYVIGITTLINISLWGLFIYFYKGIVSFFSENEQLYNSSDMIILFVLSSITQLFETFQNIFQGMLKGLKMLNLLSFTMMFIFVFLMPSLSYIFAFLVKMDVSGVCLSEGISYFIMTCLLCYWFYLKIDLDKSDNSF